MKTTVDIPDDLVRRAKISAAKAGISMRSLVIEGLVHSITKMEASGGSAPPAWQSAFGGMRQRRTESQSILRNIEDAFEQIDEDAWE